MRQVRALGIGVLVLGFAGSAGAVNGGNLFEPLPAAEYPTVCGNQRTDVETVKLVALQALLVAEELQAAAEEALADVRHASLQIAVLAGEGANTSLVAEPFDIAVAVAKIAKVAAKATFEDLEFFDNCINSAEIEGSYERLGATGERLDEMAVRDIEGHLYGKDVLASLYLPNAAGGRLEQVRAIVADFMGRAGAAGLPTGKSAAQLAAGDALLAASDYQGAFLKYRNAYKFIGKP